MGVGNQTRYVGQATEKDWQKEFPLNDSSHVNSPSIGVCSGSVCISGTQTLGQLLDTLCLGSVLAYYDLDLGSIPIKHLK